MRRIDLCIFQILFNLDLVMNNIENSSLKLSNIIYFVFIVLMKIGLYANKNQLS
jgi:hypothetical protein